MKKIFYKILLIGSILTVSVISCNDNFLQIEPTGTINETTLATKTGINGLLIGAYSLLDGVGAPGGHRSASLNILATMASDDAHVGTIPNALLASIEAYTHDPTTSSTNDMWVFLYAAIQRTNDVLRILPKVTDLSPEERIQIEAEAKFLRAVYYLKAALLYRNIPYIDETVTYGEDNYKVSNTEPIWPKIESDFQFAIDNLTPTKTEVGRANNWAAKAFMVKTYMFQYKFNEAKVLLSDIIANGQTSNGKKYALNEFYFDNFRSDKKHGPEAVFVAQMSVKDGSGVNNGNAGDYLNGPFGGPATPCCGWMQPSFDIADAYQTDSNTGLPLIDSYINTPIKTDQGLSSSEPFTPHQGTLDSRLDWVLGRRGIPYLDWGVHPGSSWIMQQSSGGPYTAIKNIAFQARVETDRDNYATNNPYSLIRFADVLLWAAEVEVEVGSLAEAEKYVNQVRARAAKPEGWVKKYIDDDAPLKGFSSTPAANYKVGLYSGHFVQNGKDFAREAVRFERRLELALEHHRFFDLQRYDNGTGYMANVLNPYLEREANVPNYFNQSYMSDAFFTKGKNEIYPIPQVQIDLSVVDGSSVLKQNSGY